MNDRWTKWRYETDTILVCLFFWLDDRKKQQRKKIYGSIIKKREREEDTHIYLYTFFFENNNTKARKNTGRENKGQRWNGICVYFEERREENEMSLEYVTGPVHRRCLFVRRRKKEINERTKRKRNVWLSFHHRGSIDESDISSNKIEKSSRRTRRTRSLWQYK